MHPTMYTIKTLVCTKNINQVLKDEFLKNLLQKTEEDGCKVTLQHLYSVHCLPSSSQWRLISIILLTFFHRCYISGNGANCGNCNTKGWRGGFDFLKF